eukprot:COSAG02_NODE_1759_length_11042_cov_3.648725_1_plen_28_part_10
MVCVCGGGGGGEDREVVMQAVSQNGFAL